MRGVSDVVVADVLSEVWVLWNEGCGMRTADYTFRCPSCNHVTIDLRSPSDFRLVDPTNLKDVSGMTFRVTCQCGVSVIVKL